MNANELYTHTNERSNGTKVDIPIIRQEMLMFISMFYVYGWDMLLLLLYCYSCCSPHNSLTQNEIIPYKIHSSMQITFK